MPEELSVQYQVFVQNLAERRFVASVVGMPAVSVEAATEEEAIARATAALESQLATGKFFTIEVEPTVGPHASTFPMRHAGIFADDPTFEDWVEKLKLIRQQANSVEE